MNFSFSPINIVIRYNTPMIYGLQNTMVIELRSPDTNAGEFFFIFRKIITLLLYLAWVAAQRHEKRHIKAGKNLQEMVKRSEILAELYLDSGCL